MIASDAVAWSLQCMEFKDRGPKLTGLMRAIMSKLEKDKPGAGLSDNDKEYCRNFAETVFNRADRIDRAGRADKGTALTFYAASIFIDVSAVDVDESTDPSSCLDPRNGTFPLT